MRYLTAADAPAVAALAETGQSTTGGLMRMHAKVQPEAVVRALDNGHVAVVTEMPGQAGIVAVGWMILGRCWLEGAVRPYAYLYGLRVHPAHRRRGVQTRNTALRLARVRDEFGDEVVVFARVNPANLASLGGTVKWSTQRLEGSLATWAVRMRAGPPRRLPGVVVRPVEAADLEEYAAGVDACYAGVNFYPQRHREHFNNLLRPPVHGLVAVDGRGRLLAGLAATELRHLSPIEVEYAHPLVRWAVMRLGVISPDGIIAPVHVRDFWALPGQAAAAAHLWQHARWRFYGRGHTLTITLDTRTAAARAVRPLLLRRAAPIVLPLAASVPVDASKPIYIQHT
jgi:hypothetical protein